MTFRDFATQAKKYGKCMVKIGKITLNSFDI